MQLQVKRRDFLKAGGGVLFGTLALSSGLLSLAPSRSWALELTTLDSNTGETLLKFTRHIFPHATLDDAVYALVVKDLDAAASGNAEIASLLNDGVAALNEQAGGDWLAADADAQLAIVKAMAGQAFFEKVRSTSVVSLYNNDMAWAHFGYEGPSFVHGGYINRGFQDLDWLPNPPEDASPPKA